MFKEFKTFIARGNVLDLAVAVIIGAAFSRIVSSLTDDIIMPVIGKITGDLDFSNYFFRMGPVPASYAGSLDSYADLKKAGVAMIGYGQFITVAVNFLIVSFIIFMLIRAVHRLVDRQKREDAAEAAAAPAPEAADLVLLREIRDELRARR